MTSERIRPRVVMVEDEDDFQVLVHEWLEPEFEHLPLKNGEDLIAHLDDLNPSVVVLDVVMPGMDGFELCRRIRAKRRYKNLPVLFLTGATRVEDFRQNLLAGGTAYLPKPVGRKQLVGALRGLLPSPAGVDDGGGD